MSAKRIGVIDVGSNSIKLLVAERGIKEPISVVRMAIQEKRIGEGTTGNPPIIDDQAIEHGAQAIATLVSEAEEDQVNELHIVATSAVRDAANQKEFIEKVQHLCGRELKVLSGNEEAHYISQGVNCDPALSDFNNFFLLDLGGGSMECIHREHEKVTAAHSFQLGAVRLSSKFVSNRIEPLSVANAEKIKAHVKTELQASIIKAPTNKTLPVILTGGAARLISYHFSEEQCASGVSPREFQEAVDKICSANKSDRTELHRIPPTRADIFPAALQTLQETIDHLQAEKVYFTACNLRFGMCHSLLD